MHHGSPMAFNSDFGNHDGTAPPLLTYRASRLRWAGVGGMMPSGGRTPTPGLADSPMGAIVEFQAAVVARVPAGSLAHLLLESGLGRARCPFPRVHAAIAEDRQGRGFRGYLWG
jgi:hypothetical protein